MGEQIKYIFHTSLPLKIISAVSILLIIAGFILPPLGVIDGSVLAAVGELGGIGTLWIVYIGLMKGTSVSASKGDTTIEVHNKKEVNRYE